MKEVKGLVKLSDKEEAPILCDVKLHISEKKLIELIRSLKNGEITSIKIQNGLPVYYIINLENRRLI
jgi:hypothetical protein